MKDEANIKSPNNIKCLLFPGELPQLPCGGLVPWSPLAEAHRRGAAPPYELSCAPVPVQDDNLCVVPPKSKRICVYTCYIGNVYMIIYVDIYTHRSIFISIYTYT